MTRGEKLRAAKWKMRYGLKMRMHLRFAEALANRLWSQVRRGPLSLRYHP